MKYFVGKEAEGPHRGLFTLFVPGSETSIDRVLSVLNSDDRIKAVYFGAKNDRGITPELAERLIELPADLTVTIECGTMEQVSRITQWAEFALRFDQFHIVFSFDLLAIKDAGRITDIKFVGEEGLFWCPLNMHYYTSLSDVRYSQDAEVTP